MTPDKRRSRAEIVATARRLARKNEAGEQHSLRWIASALAEKGMLSPSGRPYLPGSVALMIGPVSKRTRTWPKAGSSTA